MNCPNCGFHNADDALFCESCGFRFNNIPQVEPIRVVIPQLPETPPNFTPPPTVIVKQPAKSISTCLVVALTVLITLLLIGTVALGYVFLSTRQNGEAVAANANANPIIAENADPATANPAPTTYEDLVNKIAPPDKSTQLIDEEFAVATISHRAVPFSINNPHGAKLAGGFRVTKGKPINFYVYPADAYEQYPTNGLKPVHLEQTGNKILNERLSAGDYFLVFENNDDQPVTVAAQLFLVDE